MAYSYRNGVVVGSPVTHKKTGEKGEVVSIKGGLNTKILRCQIKWSGGLTNWVNRKDLKV